MKEKRISLFRHLPEIYRIKDKEQEPPGQLEEYIGLVEDIFDKIHFDIENLYHNLFIDSCADWVVPYIGDLYWKFSFGRRYLDTKSRCC